ncbi:MAG: hypothetical protein Q4P79_01835 [Fusobacterium sp.]|nr:hypothetical protein [Fusobacterium sp.]MDO5788176.1 hypothetical protein [Fusobacterium sp.]
MKKLILLCILVLSMLGCSSMQTGTSKIVENKNYTKVTDNEVFYIEDLITLEKYYTVASLSIQNNIIKASRDIRIDLKFYPNSKNTYMLFPNYSIGAYNFLKGILFSNGENVLNLKFKNFSNIIDSDVPNIRLEQNQIEDLLEILKNPKKITLRVYTADGYFDILFNDKFRNGFIDLLEISLKG